MVNLMEDKQIFHQNKITNSFYLEEDRRYKTKDSFDFVLEKIEKYLQNRKKASLCDIGCATGDFIWSLLNHYFRSDLTITGKDINEEMIEIARQRMPMIEFCVGNGFETDGEFKYDIITCMGVLYLYENPIDIINRILSQINDGGICYIFGHFNQYGYKVKYEYSKSTQMGIERFCDYAHDKMEISKWLEKNGLEHKWYDFEIKTRLSYKENNPLRVWTEEMKNGSLLQVDGLDRIKKQYLLEIFI